MQINQANYICALMRIQQLTTDAVELVERSRTLYVSQNEVGRGLSRNNGPAEPSAQWNRIFHEPMVMSK